MVTVFVKIAVCLRTYFVLSVCHWLVYTVIQCPKAVTAISFTFAGEHILYFMVVARPYACHAPTFNLQNELLPSGKNSFWK